MHPSSECAGEVNVLLASPLTGPLRPFALQMALKEDMC